MKHKHGWVLTNDSSPNQQVCLECREVRAIPKCKHNWRDLGGRTKGESIEYVSVCDKCRSLSGWLSTISVKSKI